MQQLEDGATTTVDGAVAAGIASAGGRAVQVSCRINGQARIGICSVLPTSKLVNDGESLRLCRRGCDDAQRKYDRQSERGSRRW